MNNVSETEACNSTRRKKEKQFKARKKKKVALNKSLSKVVKLIDNLSNRFIVGVYFSGVILTPHSRNSERCSKSIASVYVTIITIGFRPIKVLM